MLIDYFLAQAFKAWAKKLTSLLSPLLTFFAAENMKPGIFRILQFIASLLILMEAIRQLDVGFNFPWIYFISGIVMMTLVPLIPVLNSKYYITGAVIYFAETILLFIVGLHYWSDMKQYGALIYIITALLLCLSGFRNIRKA